MNKFMPTMYKKSIFDIDYKKLKDLNVKVLLFDFDNTIIELGNKTVSTKTIDLFKKLNKEFDIYVISNSIDGKKLKQICERLDISYIKNSAKPFKRGFKKLKLDNVKNDQIVMIGDQILTDIYGASKMGYKSILVDPINKKEFILTKLNRVLERIISKKIKFERGKYYD